jgi:DNA invertase Pin-like site-specific DNA recombinase
MVLTIMSAVAQFERTRIGERIREAKTQMRRQGRSLGGIRPFGFRVDEANGEQKLVPIAEEQAAIVEIIALRARGASLMAIRDRLRAKGHAISHETVRRLLARQAKGGVA